MDDLIQQGVAAFKAGKRDEARQIFASAIKQNPDNDRAWVGMYNVALNDKERIYCLQQMLRIKPENEKARQQLDRLLASSTDPKPSLEPVSPPISQVASSAIAQNENVSAGNVPVSKTTNIQSRKKNKKQNRSRWINYLIFGVGAFGLICACLIFSPTLGYMFFNRQPVTSVAENQISQTPTPPAGKWRVSTSISELDDSTTVVLSLDAENYVQGWLDNALPRLILRCKEKEINAYVNLGTQPEVEYGLYDAATVRVRFDQGEAVTMTANESTKGDALFFQNPVEMIELMLQSKEMVFEFTPFNANPAVTTFDLRGLESVITPLKQSCE